MFEEIPLQEEGRGILNRIINQKCEDLESHPLSSELDK